MGDDLISRQAAIDAVLSLCDDCDSGYCGSCRVNWSGEKDAIKALEDLPSAQPEVLAHGEGELSTQTDLHTTCTQLAPDCISRTKAILDVACGNRTIWFQKNEPHTIYCDIRREEWKDCEHWRINYYQDVETCFEHRNIDGTEQATRPEDYCSWAERREE